MMNDLSLFQSLFVLGCAGVSAVVLINALFDVYFRQSRWDGWGPMD